MAGNSLGIIFQNNRTKFTNKYTLILKFIIIDYHSYRLFCIIDILISRKISNLVKIKRKTFAFLFATIAIHNFLR